MCPSSGLWTPRPSGDFDLYELEYVDTIFVEGTVLPCQTFSLAGFQTARPFERESIFKSATVCPDESASTPKVALEPL